MEKAFLQEVGPAGNGKPSKTKKPAKDNANSKGITPAAPARRAILSQSISFPARGSRANGIKKTFEGAQVKANSKPVTVKASKGSATSGTYKQASIKMDLKETKLNGSAASLTRTMTGSRHSLVRLICNDYFPVLLYWLQASPFCLTVFL